MKGSDFSRFADTQSVSRDLKRKSVSGALSTAAGGGLDFILRLGSTLILARLLVPEDFGLVAMVTAFTRFAESFATLGLSTATVQAPKLTDRQCSNLFWINVAVGLLFAVTLAVLAPAIAGFYGDERLQTISVVIGLSFVSTGLSAQHLALLRRQMKLSRLAGIQLVATFLSVCLAIALAFGGFGYWALVWKEVAQSFLLAAGAWALCPWVPRLPRGNADMRRLLAFGRDMTLTQVLLAASAHVDTVLIGKFAGAVPLGLYRQAYYLIQAPMDRLNRPIASASQPGLSILQFEPERYRRYYQRIAFVVGFITIPLGVFAAVYAEEIVAVALGEKWQGSVIFLRIFGLLAAIRHIVGTTGFVLITRGHSGRFLVLSIVYSATAFVLMLIGLQWGAVGVATAHLAAAVLLTPWILYFSLAGTPVPVGAFLQSVSRPAIASIAMAGALFVLRSAVEFTSAPLSLATACGTALVVYFLTLFALPGGKNQLLGLGAEFVAALRRRTAGEADADKEGATAH